MKKLLFYLFLVFSALNTVAHANRGVPYIKNYSPATYKAHASNYEVVEDQRGVVFFANNSGVLEFEGKNWRLVPLPDKKPALALALSKEGRLFVGSKKEFGYLNVDSIGRSHYVSLVDKLPKSGINFEQVLHVHGTQKGAIFQTRNAFLFYENDSITVLEIPSGIDFSHAIKGKIYTRIWNQGFFELKQQKLVAINHSAILQSSNLVDILPFDEEQMLVVSRYKGLYLFDGENLKEFKNEFTLENPNATISSAAVVGKIIYIGTTDFGLFAMNYKGEIVQHLNKSYGLGDDGIQAIYVDLSNNLWLGLNNGISYIETNSPLTYFDARYNLKGTVYTTLLENNVLYVGTSHGLFYRNWIDDLGNNSLVVEDFKMVEGLKGTRINAIVKYGNRILVGHERGFSEIDENHNMVELVSLGAVWKLDFIANGKLLMLGTNSGLMIYARTKSWSMKYHLGGFDQPCASFEIDNSGDVWVVQEEQGILRLRLNEDGSKLIDAHLFNETDGLPNTKSNILFVFNDNEVLVYSGQKVVRYSNTHERFVLDERFKNVISATATITQIQQDGTKHLWYSSDEGIGEIGVSENALADLSNIAFKKFSTISVEHINPIDEDNILFGTTYGVIHYNSNSYTDLGQPFIALIRQVEVITQGDSTVFYGTFASEKGIPIIGQTQRFYPKLKFSENSLRINFAACYYESNDLLEYSYYLEGFDNSWSNWSSKTDKEYTNIPEGDYIFHVKSRNVYGQESIENTFSFTVLPPWSRSLWAYILYLLVFGLILFVSFKLNTKRLMHQKAELEKIVAVRTAEISFKNEELQQQKDAIEAHSKAIEEINNEMQLKNQRLYIQTHEIQQKNNEIEQINKSITDSILYAKQIQDAMLPRRHRVMASIPNSFIMLKPRDIVSGDFYWLNYGQTPEGRNFSMVAAVDCTGHGVPGAFMSMIGMELINKIVSQRGTYHPDEILSQLNDEIVASLKQHESSNRDGMDMSLAVYFMDDNVLEFAGANNPMLYIQDGELVQVIPDKMGIGGVSSTNSKKEFKRHTIQINEPTSFYLFTDGFNDQFGGPKGKKFMISRFKEMLLEITELSMYEQHQIVEQTLENWMGIEEQVDDILVIGFELTPN